MIAFANVANRTIHVWTQGHTRRAFAPSIYVTMKCQNVPNFLNIEDSGGFI